MTGSRLESKETQQTTQELTSQQHPLRSVSINLVKEKIPDRGYFFKSTIKELYNALLNIFALDKREAINIRKAIYPLLTSGFAYTIGELLTLGMSYQSSDSNEEQNKYKFYLGTAMLAASALHNLTEDRITSTNTFSWAIANDVVGILFTMTSSYQLSRKYLHNFVEEGASLILSIGASVLAYPGLFSLLVQKFSEFTNRWNTSRGSQRSDTSRIPRGLTPIANMYFQIFRFLTEALSSPTQLFSIANIGQNFVSNSYWVPRIKNIPTLIADRGPIVIAKIRDQKEKIDADYKVNTTKVMILKDSELVPIEMHKLRIGHKVYCDPIKMNLKSIPVTGDIIALKKIDDKKFSDELEEKEFGVNLSAHNGEYKIIKIRTPLKSTKNNTKVDLHMIHSGTRSAILAGAELEYDLTKINNLFFVIRDQTERTSISAYEKNLWQIRLLIPLKIKL